MDNEQLMSPCLHWARWEWEDKCWSRDLSSVSTGSVPVTDPESGAIGRRFVLLRHKDPQSETNIWTAAVETFKTSQLGSQFLCWLCNVDGCNVSLLLFPTEHQQSLDWENLGEKNHHQLRGLFSIWSLVYYHFPERVGLWDTVIKCLGWSIFSTF